MRYIRKHIANFDFNIVSITYLLIACIVIMKFPLLLQDKTFLVCGLFLSVAFIFCAYNNKKTIVNKMIEHSIIKWIGTVLIFSSCMWYAKHKINFDYDIQPEYLIYSSYGYAFAMAIPLSLSIYGLSIFIYLYLGRITAYQCFYAAILTIPFSAMLRETIEKNQEVDFKVIMLLVFGLAFGIITMFKAMPKTNKESTSPNKKNLLYIAKTMAQDINRAKLILMIWFKKILICSNSFLRVADLLSTAIALLFIGVFSIKIIPEYQKSFLLLDAFSKTDCNTKKDSFSYIRKSKNECYRINSKGIEIIEMISFTSSAD